MNVWRRLPESNQRPSDYKSAALPTELNRRRVSNALAPKRLQFRPAGGNAFADGRGARPRVLLLAGGAGRMSQGGRGEAEMFRRSMHRLGNLLITVSAITPAASVFIMGSDVIKQAGTGAVICFAAAAVLGLLTAFVYAELSSAFPLTGGEYSMIGHTLGPSFGFMALGLNVFGGALGQAVTALGLAEYLGVVA